jgi:hypothetical protein
MNYSNSNLPPACNGVDPCTDQACQQAIAATHIISEQEFQNRIIQSAGQPRMLTASDMQDIINAGTCGSDMIVLDQNVEYNADLNPAVSTSAGGLVAYSFPMFKGILSQNPESFSFYLATATEGRDVIFSVSFGGGASDQFYDNSTNWP